MDGVDLSSIMVQEASQAPDQKTSQTENLPQLPELEKRQQSAAPKEESKDVTDRSTQITKMKLYFDCFDAKLKQIRPKNIDKLSDEELQDLQTKIHFILGAKTNVEAMTKTLPMILKAVEDLSAQFTPLRIQGTHLVCFEPEVQDMIRYCIIDSGLGGITSSPQQRLLFTLLTTAVRQHTINSMVEAMSPEQKQAMASSLQANTQVKKPVLKKPVKTEGTTDDGRFADL